MNEQSILQQPVASLESLQQLVERFIPVHTLLSQNKYMIDSARRLKRIIDDAQANTILLFAGKERVGKTTLINSLLGRNVLHVDPATPTSADTFIKYGEEEYVRAVFTDGMSVHFDLQFAEMLTTGTTSSAEIIREHLDYLEIYIKHDALKYVTLVDSMPVQTGGRKSAYFSDVLLQRADEVFWVLRAGSQIPESEMILLEKLQKRGITPYFLLNATDELKERVLTIREKKALLKPLSEHVLAVSAKQAVQAERDHQMQPLIDSNIVQLKQLIDELQHNPARKTAMTVKRFIDWLQFFARDLYYMTQREPFLSAKTNLAQFKGSQNIEDTRKQRDLAILDEYHREYEHVCSVFKPIETLYQLLQLLTTELYLRDADVEAFEEVASSYLQHVRDYRKLHVEYMRAYGVLDSKHRKVHNSPIERWNREESSPMMNKEVVALNDMQRKLEQTLEKIGENEAYIREQLYPTQNRLTELAAKRLQTILQQSLELNTYRKLEMTHLHSYNQKLTEFSCIEDAQRVIEEAVKPYLLGDALPLTLETKALAEQMIEAVGYVKLSIAETVVEVPEQEEQEEPLSITFEAEFQLKPLHLTEQQVISADIPELPGKIGE